MTLFTAFFQLWRARANPKLQWKCEVWGLQASAKWWDLFLCFVRMSKMDTLYTRHVFKCSKILITHLSKEEKKSSNICAAFRVSFNVTVLNLPAKSEGGTPADRRKTLYQRFYRQVQEDRKPADCVVLSVTKQCLWVFVHCQQNLLVYPLLSAWGDWYHSVIPTLGPKHMCRLILSFVFLPSSVLY